MRWNSRVLIISLQVGLLVGIGVVATNVILMLSGIYLGLWLLIGQSSFITFSSKISELDILWRIERSQISVNESVTCQLQAEHSKPQPFDISIGVILPPSIESPDGDQTFVFQKGETQTELEFDLTGTVVGETRLGKSEIEFTGPESLFTTSIHRETSISIEVLPRAPSRLQIGAGKQTLLSLYNGHRGDRISTGIGPQKVREYAPGDKLARMDWKATARLNSPHIREYERDESNATALVVDHRASMGTGQPAKTKLDYLREVALAFAGMVARFDDSLGVYTVGDEGTTNNRNTVSGTGQHDSIRKIINALEPTRKKSRMTEEPSTPADARTRTNRLEGDQTTMSETLGPYFESTESYVRRLRDRPLFKTVQLAHSSLRSESWVVILTDDSNRTELREAVKYARQNRCQVLVFLAPSVLYDPGALADLDRAYDRYRDFETFRKSLASLDRVSAFEITPGDRVDSILDRQRASSSRQTGERGRNRSESASARGQANVAQAQQAGETRE